MGNKMSDKNFVTLVMVGFVFVLCCVAVALAFTGYWGLALILCVSWIGGVYFQKMGNYHDNYFDPGS